MAEQQADGTWVLSHWYLILVLAPVYMLTVGLYNLYFHPLRHIPGPKRAAFSRLYEFWFDVIQDGQYIWEIERMHNEYGPIVRINPHSIHIRDSHYYSTIYANGRRADKDPMTASALSVPTSAFSTVDHDLHRVRRGYISNYFSKRAVVSIEPIIHERVSKLFRRIEGICAENGSLNLDRAFSAMTCDIICRRLYGDHFNYLDIPDFSVFATQAASTIFAFYHLARFVPSVVSALRSAPFWFQKVFVPILKDYTLFRQHIARQIELGLERHEDGKPVSSAILTSLLDPEIPPPDRSLSRLIDEAATITMAGTETTARALSIAIYYLLENESCLKRLQQELSTLPNCDNNEFSLSSLESLPYLSGVVCEAFRLSFGSIARLPRVSPTLPLQYGDYVIPAETPVSQSSYFVSTDPSIYPDPFHFNPERWIRARESRENLRKYLVTFSKGTRQCLGMQLSEAEMFITLARIILAFDMELYNTTSRNVRIECERVLGFPKQPLFRSDSTGEIMVKIIGKHGN